MEKIRILILEDNPADAELVERELKRGEIDHVSTRVSNKEDFAREIVEHTPDLILADYSLPQFNAMEALLMLECKDLAYIPFIIVTGTVREEIAMKCVKNGAWDYVIKDHLLRLSTSVKGALAKRSVEKQRDLALDRLEKLNRALLDLGADHEKNINKLVAVTEEIMRASSAVYDRLDGGSLCSQGQWSAPKGGNTKDDPEGYICYDVMKKGGDEVFTVKDLPNTKYAKTDPNVAICGLKTYMGKSVKLRGKSIGAICVVFKDDVVLSEEDEKFLGIIASAIAVEEDREKAANALRDSREYLDKIINTIGDPVFVKDEEHKWVLLNKAACVFWGYSREELIGKSDYDFLPKDQADALREKDKEVFRTGKENVNEEIIVDPMGNRRIVTTKKTLYTDKKGKKFIVGIANDITERKTMEEELYHQQEFSAALLDSASDGVVACDASGRLVLFNRIAREWHGLDIALLPQEELAKYYGLYGEDGVTPLTIETIPLLRALRGEKVQDAAMVIRAEGQAPRFVMASGASFFAADGRKLGAVAVMRDVTSGKKTDDERKRQTELAYRTSDALLKISKLNTDTFETFLSKVSEIGAQTVTADRVSVWFFSEDLTELVCSDLYDKREGTHKSGERIKRDKYPRYFEALDGGRTIDACDAINDPRTSEFLSDYLLPNGIVSMMDVPMRRSGRVIGVVCHEQTASGGQLRVWDAIERDFAIAVADTIVVAIEGQEREKAKDELRKKLVELNHYKEITVGRENRMIDLKREVNKLSKELGQAEPYDVSFAD